MKAPRKKPVDGHRLDRVRYGVEVLCECGWCSCVYYGKGARREAYAEWRSHLRRSCSDRTAAAPRSAPYAADRRVAPVEAAA